MLQLNSDIKPMAIRNVKADQIGKLVNIRGIVTRATEVKPMLQGNFSLIYSSSPFQFFLFNLDLLSWILISNSNWTLISLFHLLFIFFRLWYYLLIMNLSFQFYKFLLFLLVSCDQCMCCWISISMWFLVYNLQFYTFYYYSCYLYLRPMRCWNLSNNCLNQFYAFADVPQWWLSY